MEAENIIKHFLTKAKMTQKDLAEALNVSPSNITEWKKKEYIPYDQNIAINKLASKFGITTGRYESELEWNALGIEKNNIQRWLELFSEALEDNDCGRTWRYHGEEEMLERETLSFVGMLNNHGIEYPVKPRTFASDLPMPTEEDIENDIIMNGEEWTEFFEDFIEQLVGHHEYFRVIIQRDADLLWQESEVNIENLEATIPKLALAKSLPHAEPLLKKDVKAPLSHIREIQKQIFKEFREDIYELTKEMRNRGLEITSDYFSMTETRLHGQWFYDEAELQQIAPGMDYFTSWGEKRTLWMTEDIVDRISDLESKVNLLLNHFNIPHVAYADQEKIDTSPSNTLPRRD